MDADGSEESSEIGDKLEGMEEDALIKEVRPAFPWRVFLLSLSRMMISVACYMHGGSQLVVRRDGSTTAKRLIKKKYNYLKFTSHKYNMVPVLSLSLNADPALAVVSTASSFGLLVAVVITYFRWRRKDQDARPHSMMLAALLTMIELQLVTLDMINGWSQSVHYSHMILSDVGLQEAASFFLTSAILNGVQTYLWFGGLEFRKTFLEK